MARDTGERFRVTVTRIPTLQERHQVEAAVKRPASAAGCVVSRGAILACDVAWDRLTKTDVRKVKAAARKVGGAAWVHPVRE